MIVHYMDNLLIEALTEKEMEKACGSVVRAVQDAGFNLCFQNAKNLTMEVLWMENDRTINRASKDTASN